MHPVAKSIIEELDPSVYAVVAGGVLGDDSMTVAGAPTWSEITAPHADERSLAILKVEGRAKDDRGEAAWSSVVKVIDTSAEVVRAAQWVDPAREVAVYESGLFIADGLRFRPAECYLVSRPAANVTLLWLEDLSSARGTPFTVPEFEALCRDLGEFNGFHARHAVQMPFEPARDSYMARWRNAEFPARLERMANLADQEVPRRVHANTPLAVAAELHEELDRLARRSLNLPHALSFGDCQAGNLFRLGDETVAIDWASLTMDPTGVDAGCLIGSSITWGRRCADMVLVERQLFDSYVEGLLQSGWSGDPDDIRRGFFGQFGQYLMLMCTVSDWIVGEEVEKLRDFLEKRFQTPLEEIPDLLVPIIDMAPKYLEEAKALLD